MACGLKVDGAWLVGRFNVVCTRALRRRWRSVPASGEKPLRTGGECVVQHHGRGPGLTRTPLTLMPPPFSAPCWLTLHTPTGAPACPRHSAHVVRLLGACLDDKSRLALVMELCEGGSLAQRIYSPSKRRLEHLEVRPALQRAAALRCIHVVASYSSRGPATRRIWRRALFEQRCFRPCLPAAVFDVVP